MPLKRPQDQPVGAADSPAPMGAGAFDPMGAPPMGMAGAPGGGMAPGMDPNAGFGPDMGQPPMGMSPPVDMSTDALSNNDLAALGAGGQQGGMDPAAMGGDPQQQMVEELLQALQSGDPVAQQLLDIAARRQIAGA